MCLDHSASIHFLLILICAVAGFDAGAQDGFTQDAGARGLFEQALAYENGEGEPRDPLRAAKLYCQAAYQGDREAQYNLGWMYANGRGVLRNDATAAFFFHAAAQQGLAAAKRMLTVVGEPVAEVPECMRPPTAPPVEPEMTATRAPAVDYKAIAPHQIFDMVVKLAPQFKIEPQLAFAIIAAESNFNPRAQSVKRAQGLMQLVPQTSERFNVTNAFDPAQNIRGGLTYLRWLLAYFEGDVALVAAAYNAGERTVERYRGVPPYLETRSYVQRILASFGDRVHPFEATIARPSPLLKTSWRQIRTR